MKKKSIFLITLLTLFTFVLSITTAYATSPWLEQNKGVKNKVQLQLTKKATEKTEAKMKDFKGKIIFCGQVVKFELTPQEKGGRILIPLRAIAAALKAEVSYETDGERQIITVVKDDKTVVIELDGSTNKAVIYVNGEELQDADFTPMLSKNRTFVPLRFLAEVFKLKVDYNGDVIIDEPEQKTIAYQWYDFVTESFSSEQRNVVGTWHQNKYVEDMDFAVITSQAKARAIDRPPLTIEDFDFERYFMLHAYLGEAPTGGYDLKITNIYQQEDTVWIKVRTISPAEDDLVTQVINYPSDTIRLKKSNLLQTGELTFIFVDQNSKVLKRVEAEI